MVDKFAGSEFEQRSVCDAGPEGVAAMDGRHKAVIRRGLKVGGKKSVEKIVTIGEVAEWSKAAVLKTVEGQPSQGSNPCLSAINK